MPNVEALLFDLLGEAARLLAFLRGVLGLNGLINICLTLIGIIGLYIVQRRVRRTLKKLSIALSTIQEQSNALLEQVDRAVDTLTTRVERTKTDLSEAVEEAFSRATATARLPSAANSNEPVPDPIDFWNEMQQIWMNTRDEVKRQLTEVAAKIPDGRRRKRYENISLKNFENVIYRLDEDNWISGDATEALLEMNAMFNRRRNRKRPVAEDEIVRFRKLRQTWTSVHMLASDAA